MHIQNAQPRQCIRHVLEEVASCLPDEKKTHKKEAVCYIFSRMCVKTGKHAKRLSTSRELVCVINNSIVITVTIHYSHRQEYRLQL